MFRRINCKKLNKFNSVRLVSSLKDKTPIVSTIINPNDIKSKYGITNEELIDSNYGLREFMKKTYLWTGGGIAGSTGIAILGGEILQQNSNIISCGYEPSIFFSSFVLAIGGAIGISFTNYTTHKDIITNKNVNSSSNDRQERQKSNNSAEILYSINSTGRLISYGSLVSGMGVTMVPLCGMFPHALIPAFVASSSIFAGSTLWAMKKGVGELKPYGSILYGGLSGLVGVSLMGLGSNLFFGTNWFGDMTHLISLYGGIPLFTGLIAYDTHKAIEMYESGNPDHLGCSTQLYLDFINLFVRFIEIINKIQND
jgi:FtsH-binding integral membrane protein